MNRKAKAKEKLRRYNEMRAALQNIPEEIKRLELEQAAIRAARSDGTPVKGGGNGREDAMINNIDTRQELEWSLENAKSWVRQVDRALGTLPPDQRLILARMYLFPERGAADRLCGELGVEIATVYRKRDRAVRAVAIALYGAEES